jgi:hypothetical protein
MTLEDFLVNFIKRGIISHFFSDQTKGMCGNIIQECSRKDELKFTGTFKSWPESSGVPSYPILDRNSSLDACSQYRYSKHFIGKQLRLRKSLARHALKELYGRTV